MATPSRNLRGGERGYPFLANDRGLIRGYGTVRLRLDGTFGGFLCLSIRAAQPDMLEHPAYSQGSQRCTRKSARLSAGTAGGNAFLCAGTRPSGAEGAPTASLSFTWRAIDSARRVSPEDAVVKLCVSGSWLARGARCIGSGARVASRPLAWRASRHWHPGRSSLSDDTGKMGRIAQVVGSESFSKRSRVKGRW